MREQGSSQSFADLSLSVGRAVAAGLIPLPSVDRTRSLFVARMKFHLLLPAFVALVSSASALAVDTDSSGADGLKERIVEHARTVKAEDYAYTRTARTESTEGDKKEERVVVERWDPGKPLDQRWTLVSINGQPPTADQLESYRKELPKRRQAYYGRVAGYFAKPATSAVDARGRTIFRFASLPKETVMVNNADISANASGEVVVNTSGAMPFIEEVHFSATKPTRVKLIATIDHFETTTRYRLMPDGKPVPIEGISDMTGSMLGQQGNLHTRVTYADHRAVGK